MRIAHCPFPDCTYKTPRMETEVGACTLVLAHTQVHIVARMCPPPPPPVVAPRFFQNPLLIPSPLLVPPAPPFQVPVLSPPPNKRRRHVSAAPDARRPLPFGHRKILEGIRRSLPTATQCVSSSVLETDPLFLSGSSDTDAETASEILISNVRSMVLDHGNTFN